MSREVSRRLPRVAIVHNHPIHYKNLLFKELVKGGLDFHVVFSAATSRRRISADIMPEGYSHSFATEGAYEKHSRTRVSVNVWRALDRIDPEVLVIGGYNDAAAWSALLWAEKRNRPKVMWFESNQFDYRRWYWRELPKRFFVRRCQGAHVYGTTNAAYLQALGMPAEHIVSKRAVIDLDRLGSELHGHDRQEPRTFLFVGRFAKEKNLSFLLDAFNAVAARGLREAARLVLVGYGPEEESLRKQAAALPSSRLIEFWPPVRQQEIGKIYRQADVFVLPSLCEPWGLVVLEAMYCGVAAAASTQCGCVTDVVSENVGWSFSPFERSSLEAVLEHALRLPRAALAEMGNAARETAKIYNARNSAAIVLGHLEAVYRSAGQ